MDSIEELPKRIIKFRCWNPRHNSFKYWGFIDGYFIGPPTGSGLTIEACSKSDRFTGLLDKNVKEIYEGDVLSATLNVMTSERTSTYKRQRSTFAVYSDVEAIGAIEMGAIGIWIWKSDKSITYNTGFWRGCGNTRSEKRANESRPTTYNLTRPLHEVLKTGEVIGNIYQNPDLL